MNKQAPDKKEVLNRLTQLEILLCKLKDEVLVCEHKNALVQDCIDKTDKSLQSAVQKIGRGDIETAAHLAGVAYLRLNFGKQLMVAEILESEVGESDFLQLTEAEVENKPTLETLFERANQILLGFIAECKSNMAS